MQPWALDTETFLIFPGQLAPPMVCTTWAHGSRGSGLIHGRDPGLGLFINDRLLHEHTVFANAPYDLGVYGAKWPQLIGQIIYWFNRAADRRTPLIEYKDPESPAPVG